jgi:hypothetical protein
VLKNLNLTAGRKNRPGCRSGGKSTLVNLLRFGDIERAAS